MSSSLLRKIFTDYFPPPKFLEMPTVGIDISDEMIRFVELKRHKEYYKLGRYGQKKIPKDVVEEGYIKDKESLAKILNEIRVEQGIEFVIGSLPEEKSYIFKTHIPQMPDADMYGALQYKIEENVPIAVRDAIFDYKVMKESVGKNGELEVGVIAIHTKVVRRYLEVFHQSGLTPVGFQTESQAIAHIVIPRDDMGTYIIASLRESKTVLIIISHRVIYYTSTVNIGGQAIATSIKKQFSIGNSDVEKIREGREVKEKNDMMMSIVNASSVLRDEVQKLFLYWETHGEKEAISHIILSGSDALLGLDTYLARSCDVPVKIAEPWQNIIPVDEMIPQLTRRESLDYVPALGLALPHD
jgi:type IV pilus assembly protein PilM